MRRIKTVLLLFLMVISLFFVACAPEDGQVSETTAEDAPLTITGEDTLPDEYKPLNEKAKEYIAEKYGRSAMKFLSVGEFGVSDIPRYKYNGCYELRYRIDVYGYGYGNLEFTFDTEGELVHYFELREEPLKYSDILTEDKVLSAVEKIAEDAGEPLEGRDYYFFIDDENYLCLGTEIIVEFDRVEADGSVTHDHKHKFYKERIAIFPRDLFDAFE